MKNLFFIILITIFFSGCVTTYTMIREPYYTDNYYSPIIYQQRPTYYIERDYSRDRYYERREYHHHHHR